MEFVNPKTMNNARGEAAVIEKLQELGFVVNKPEVKNQPVYDLSVHLRNSISRTAYIQIKTRGENNPNGFRIGGKKRILEIEEWLENEHPKNYFVVMVDFYEGGNIHVMHGKMFIDEVMAFANDYLSKPKRDGKPRKDTGAWTFEPKWSAKVYNEAKENWKILTNYLK
jgi:hypothetical protein